MSQALDLLNSLSADEIAQYTSYPAVDPHIVINADRTITVPDSLKRIAVQYDHNMETVTFDCPRYWDSHDDDHDMSKMIVYINYVLPDNNVGSYIAQNISVDDADDTMMHFTWTVTNEITQYKGNIAFLVCVKKTEEQTVDGYTEAVEVNHWNSEINRDLYISEGLESEVNVPQQYPDIVTQLLERMTTVETINIQADEMEQLLEDTRSVAATAEEVKNQALDASGYIRNSYAPAIKGNVSGDMIRVDDVSPIEHQVQYLIRGKNLANLGALEGELLPSEASQIRITKIDPSVGDIHIYAGAGYDGNGHVNTSVKLKELCPQMRVGRQYTLSATTDAWNKCVYLNGLDYFWQFGSTITIVEEMLNCYVGFYGYAPYRGQEDDANCVICDFSIEEGPYATSFVPYIDPTDATITQHGKNLLRQTGDKSANGITMTTYEGGMVRVYGTSTDAGVNMHVGKAFMKAGYKYKPTTGLISGDIKLLYWNESSGIQTHPDSDGLLSSSVDTILTVFIYAAGAGTVFNARFKPMLQLVNENDDDGFELYSEEVIAPAQDGSCTAVSSSPTITVYTNAPGLTIEAEYNVDTTKMFESYVLTDEAKDEIAGIINNRVLTDVERAEIANMVEQDMADILASLNNYAETLVEGETSDA